MRIFPKDMSANNRTLVQTLSVVVLMGSLAWAAVPFYDWFCRVTGYAGTTSTATTGSDVILGKTITVRFVGSTERGMPWSFEPVVQEMTLKIGETGLAFFEAHNPTDRPVAGQASYNVVPDAAGKYFDKIACFCFTEQILQPGETVQMPVSFYVDPEIVNDAEGQYIHTITLGYTFFEIDLPEDEQQAALDATVLPVTETAQDATVQN
ncbi:MAG: cytochrome c oxidase assembly protein [Rhodobacterales bacterium]|jgi:cytochrome c oxidase assembly protein subunit 11|nr:cytochrome c oxidase assembly protein [Rhodobacterales bacterium]